MGGPIRNGHRAFIRLAVDLNLFTLVIVANDGVAGIRHQSQ